MKISYKVGIGFLVGVVVLSGVSFYVWNFKDSNTETNISEINLSSNEPKALVDLLAVKTPQKCTVSHITDLSESDGVVYVGQGKLRGDYTAKTSGQNVSVHVIVDGVDVYTWMDTLKLGFKTPMTDLTKSDQPIGQTFDLNQKLDYSCEDWNFNASVFALPKDVTFNSFNY